MTDKILKPCPFCGGTPDFICRDNFDGNETYWIECWDCELVIGKHDSSPHRDTVCSAGSFSTKEDAIKAWNRRWGKK